MPLPNQYKPIQYKPIQYKPIQYKPIQYVDMDDGFNFTKTQRRRYRGSLLSLKRAVKWWNGFFNSYNVGGCGDSNSIINGNGKDNDNSNNSCTDTDNNINTIYCHGEQNRTIHTIFQLG